MSTYLFALYALVHCGIFIWALRRMPGGGTPGIIVIAILGAGLTYDNGLIALGSVIGLGSTLEALSWPRFIMHAVFTPFMMIAATDIADSAGIEFTRTRWWRGAIWLLTGLMVLYGIVFDLFPLELQPACFEGLVRYTSSASPAQFCFPDQVQNPGVGAPLPSIAAVIVGLVLGVGLWRKQLWPWFFLGNLIMFIAAAIPTSRYGLKFGNGGEVVLLLAYAFTAARFSRARQ